MSNHVTTEPDALRQRLRRITWRMWGGYLLVLAAGALSIKTQSDLRTPHELVGSSLLIRDEQGAILSAQRDEATGDAVVTVGSVGAGNYVALSALAQGGAQIVVAGGDGEQQALLVAGPKGDQTRGPAVLVYDAATDQEARLGLDEDGVTRLSLGLSQRVVSPDAVYVGPPPHQSRGVASRWQQPWMAVEGDQR